MLFFYVLQKKISDKDKPSVSGASFVGMFAQDASSGDRLASADLAASTTLVSVERLRRGEKVSRGRCRGGKSGKGGNAA